MTFLTTAIGESEVGVDAQKAGVSRDRMTTATDKFAAARGTNSQNTKADSKTDQKKKKKQKQSSFKLFRKKDK